MNWLTKLAKALKYITYSLLILIALVFVFIISSLFSHQGNKFIFTSLHEWEPRATILLSEGTIFNNPTYQKISWVDENILLDFSDVSYSINWKCLGFSICVDTFKVESVQVDIKSSGEEAEPEDAKQGDAFQLNLPLPVYLDEIEINNSNIKVSGVEIDINALFLSVRGVNNALNMSSTINGLTVILSDSESVSANPPPLNAQPAFSASESFPAILTSEMLPKVSMPFDLIANKLDINRFKLIKNKEEIVNVTTAQSKFIFQNTALSVQKLMINVAEADLGLVGHIDFTEYYPLDINATIKLKKSTKLEPENLLEGQHIAISSSGDLQQLSTQIVFSNLIEAELTSRVDLLSKNLPHYLKVQATEFNWPLTGAPQISLPHLDIVNSGDLNDYKLAIEASYQLPNLPLGDIALQGEGGLNNLTLSNLSLNTLNGNASLIGELNWQEDVSWEGELAIDDMNFSSLGAHFPEQLNAHIKQSVTIERNETEELGWSFNLPDMQLSGLYLSRPYSLTGSAKGNAEEGISLQNLAVHSESNSIIVDGELGQHSDLNLDLDMKDLSSLNPDIKGKVSGGITLSGSLDDLGVQTKLQASNLVFLAHEIKRFSASGKANISELYSADMQIKAEDLLISKQPIEFINVKVTPDKSEEDGLSHSVILDLKSEIASTRLDILLKQTLDSWAVSLQGANVRSQQGIWALSSPFMVAIEEDNVELSAHCWQATNESNEYNGQFCIEKFMAGKNGEINLTLDDFLVSTLSPFMPKELKIAGTVDSEVNIWWENNMPPSINLYLNGNALAVDIKNTKSNNDYSNYPVEKLSLKIETENHQSDFNVLVTSPGLIKFIANGNLKTDLPSPQIDSTVALSLPDFNAFSVLIPFIDKMTGNLNSDIKINGAVSSPTILGNVDIADMNIDAVQLPVQATDANLNIIFDQNNAKLQGSFFTNRNKDVVKKKRRLLDKLVTLKDKAFSVVNVASHIDKQKGDLQIDSEGRAEIAGYVSWENKLEGKLHFQAEQMRINDYGNFDLFISPDLTFIMAEKMSLTGNIHIDKGDIIVKELPEGAVTVSDDIVVIDVEEERDVSDSPVMLALKISLGDMLHVKAIGLDTFIHGELLLRKEILQELTVHGELSFTEGIYRALGQQLQLEKSRILFQGPVDSPYLSIEAIRDPKSVEDNVTAGVRVNGTPDQLQLTIFSDPAMSQQNALSYITRGRSIENSAGDSQLAAVLIDMGAGQTDGLMNNIGDKVGISDLSLSSSGQGDEQSVGVRGTIAPGVEVSYGVGVFDSFSIFSIRYELFKKFYIEASSSLNHAVDAYYEWDWD